MKKGIIATVLSVGTAAIGLAREIAALWRESEPEPRRADRAPLDALDGAVASDFDGVARQIIGDRSKQ